MCVEPQRYIGFSWTTRLSSADCADCVSYNSRRWYMHCPSGGIQLSLLSHTWKPGDQASNTSQ